MPVQKIVDRAVAGRMPDRLFIDRLEIVDVQHLARTGSLGKARQQSLFPGQEVEIINNDLGSSAGLAASART